eukprot:877877-Rhodomonas_salina.1
MTPSCSTEDATCQPRAHPLAQHLSLLQAKDPTLSRSTGCRIASGRRVGRGGRGERDSVALGLEGVRMAQRPAPPQPCWCRLQRPAAPPSSHSHDAPSRTVALCSAASR